MKQIKMSKPKKTHRLYIRLTEEEWLIINELACIAGMNVSTFVIYAILNGKIIINEMDTQAILRPLLGLQRHYNTIRHWMIKHNYSNPILSAEYEQELKSLWQLLAQAKDPVAQADL